MMLSSLERRPDIADTLNASFTRMLTRYQDVQSQQPSLAPKPRPKRDFRRRRRA
jgi:DTW domain-containing protein